MADVGFLKIGRWQFKSQKEIEAFYELASSLGLPVRNFIETPQFIIFRPLDSSPDLETTALKLSDLGYNVETLAGPSPMEDQGPASHSTLPPRLPAVSERVDSEDREASSPPPEVAPSLTSPPLPRLGSGTVIRDVKSSKGPPPLAPRRRTKDSNPSHRALKPPQPSLPLPPLPSQMPGGATSVPQNGEATRAANDEMASHLNINDKSIPRAIIEPETDKVKGKAPPIPRLPARDIGSFSSALNQSHQSLEERANVGSASHELPAPENLRETSLRSAPIPFINSPHFQINEDLQSDCNLEDDTLDLPLTRHGYGERKIYPKIIFLTIIFFLALIASLYLLSNSALHPSSTANGLSPSQGPTGNVPSDLSDNRPEPEPSMRTLSAQSSANADLKSGRVGNKPRAIDSNQGLGARDLAGPDPSLVPSDPNPELSKKPSSIVDLNKDAAASKLSASRSASPITAHSSWFTLDDIPMRKKRRGIDTRITYSLAVGIDGTVSNCQASETGSSGLVDLFCSQVSKRARFKPALDESGNPVASTFKSNTRIEVSVAGPDGKEVCSGGICYKY